MDDSDGNKMRRVFKTAQAQHEGCGCEQELRPRVGFEFCDKAKTVACKQSMVVYILLTVFRKPVEGDPFSGAANVMR